LDLQLSIRFFPAFEAAAKMGYISQSHVLSRIRRQCGAAAAGAIENEALAGRENGVVMRQCRVQRESLSCEPTSSNGGETNRLGLQLLKSEPFLAAERARSPVLE
jgi:hypothetical protein